MSINKFLEIKRTQKDIIKKTKTIYEKDYLIKKLFPISNNLIKIGEKEYELEELLLNKIKLDENINKTILREFENINSKLDYVIKEKKYLTNKIDRIELELNSNIKKLYDLKNNNAYKLIFAFEEKFSSVIAFNEIFSDNIITTNNCYFFCNGERYILNEDEYEKNIISNNYKAEIIINKSKFINYIFTEESYKTNETFKIHFLYQGENFKTIKEYNPNNYKEIELNHKCDKIIIEGFSLNSIINNFKICVGRSNTNINRGVIVLEADITKTKLQDKFIFKSHNDIKCFCVNKNEFKKLNEYSEFKANYFRPESEVIKNKEVEVDLVDSYLVLFIESDINIIKKISMYGVD